jgi:translation initiation factor 2 beta subunit (eIF-2beta)/eIF-5
MSDGVEESERESRRSIWKDCAECGSGDTSLGPVDEDCPIECNDCGAQTEGINGWKAL